MSTENLQNTKTILDNLTKARAQIKIIHGDIRLADAELTRLVRTASDLSRGDITGVVETLAPYALQYMGPYGAVAALGAYIGYAIYKEATRERSNEVYRWRYPK